MSILMEYVLWSFVFVAGAVYFTRKKKMANSGQWYLIYRYQWVGKNLVEYMQPVDGVFASSTDAAIEKALTRIDYRTDDQFEARWCNTIAMRQHASDLDGRHVCEWWSRDQFLDNMIGPAYQGDQDKYLKTRV